MREIKFRGQTRTTDGNKWIYGYLYRVKSFFDDEKYQYFIRSEHLQDAVVDENTIGQYTGLKDKNGKEIYEGDIVKAIIIKPNRNTEDEYIEMIMPVVFDKGEFLLKDNNTAFGSTFHHLRLCKSIEVIGNIYENKDLLDN